MLPLAAAFLLPSLAMAAEDYTQYVHPFVGTEGAIPGVSKHLFHSEFAVLRILE
jgi:hypothetical protein